MYLEKLEINGFKSFATKNKLVFSGLIGEQKRGLTAIVGPNGSGKSNVADAIRWALGEQSLKTLRGKKSEDIIFSGSDKKGRLGSAEVSLHLNNNDKVFANKKTDLAEEKSENSDSLNEILATCNNISITRRIFRNGESEYLINDNRVRLADIQMLLAKASFGQKTYSVIGQGMVENFLTVSASERKDFFDEATGVKQFQIKRDSSLNKLENSYENLKQVDMLLLEIKPRLKSLTRQVEKLKKREEIEISLKENQTNYYSHLWHDINLKLKTTNQELLSLEKEKQEKENKLEKLNEELSKIQSKNNYREINEIEPQIRDKEAQKNLAQKELAKLQAEMESKLEAQGQFDLSWLSGKKSELEAEIENISFEIESTKKSIPLNEEVEARDKLKEINKQIQNNLELKREKNELERKLYEIDSQIARIEAVVSANKEAQAEVDISLLKTKEGQIKEERDTVLKNLENLESEKLKHKPELIKDQIGLLEIEISTLNRELNSLNQKLKENKSKLKGREEIEKLVDNFLLKLDEINRETNIDKVRALIKEAKEDFQVKIKTLITGEDQKSLEEISHIQEQIISLSEKKQSLISQLSDENHKVNIINEKINSIKERIREKDIDLEELGEKLEKASVKFDYTGAENEIRDIQKNKQEILDKITSINNNDKESSLITTKTEIEIGLQEIVIKKTSLNERLRLLEKKEGDLKVELNNIVSKINKGQIKFDASAIKNQENEINSVIEKLNKELAILRQSLNNLKEEQQQEKSAMYDIQKNAQTKQQELNQISNILAKVQMEAARQETRLEDLEANIRNENLSVLEIENHSQPELINEPEMLPKKINSLKGQLEQIGGIDPEVEKEYEETKGRYDFLKSQTDDLEKTIDSLEQIISELDKTIKLRFDAEFKIISEKFSEYFKILFNGGDAKISKIITEEKEEEKSTDTSIEGLSEEENKIKNQIDKKLRKIKQLKKHGGGDLEGIEIQAVPPGKKIQTVTMLSGGERALTAIALICAIISANPSPFVVLDEVDAALDEANSERLAKILDDLSNKTQFIIITHNRASMKKASILYGVTMQADGVSKLLSIKLDEAESFKNS